MTGQEWTFAPTVTVPQDDRWGRAYEGYSSDPELVASYAGAMVRGLQGAPGQPELPRRATRSSPRPSTSSPTAAPKNGVDQGDAQISETELRDIHGAGYGPAIEAGVATVMVSFSSWQGRKMTGNQSLITGVLKERMGFDGFTVGDWNAHGQVEGCTNDDCPQALNAGIDMYMAPDSWKPICTTTCWRRRRPAPIPMARLDEAVTRILRVKFRARRVRGGQAVQARRSAATGRCSARPSIARSRARRCANRWCCSRTTACCRSRPAGALLVAGDGADNISRAGGRVDDHLAGHRPQQRRVPRRRPRCGRASSRR